MPQSSSHSVIATISPNSKSWRFPLHELYASFVASFSFLCIGLLRAYTSPAISSMKEEPGLLNSTSLTPKQLVPLVASAAPVIGFFGTLLSGPLLQHLGRRGTLFLSSIPCICGWLLIGFAGSSVPCILTGRCLTGLSAGLATSGAPVYISECVRAEVRGRTGLLPAMMLAFGVLVGFSLSTLTLDWRNLALVMVTFPCALFVMVLLIPESPSWLLMKQKEELALNNLRKLRGRFGTTEELENELSEIKAVLSKNSRSETNVIQMIRQRSVWFPGCVLVILMIFQQLSGANAVIFYLNIILADAQPKNFTENIHHGLDESVSSVVVGVAQFLAFFLSLPLIDRFGRKILLISSALLMAVPHGILGFYYFCNNEETFSGNTTSCVTFVESAGTWLPFTCLSVFIAAYSIGFGPICFILMGELFPSEARSYLSSITSFVNFLCIFLLIWGFPSMLDFIGHHWTFWTFSGSCLVSIIFVFLFVPETKGKTLAEIENNFSKKS